MTTTTTQPLSVDTETGDHDKFAHYCWPPSGVGILSTAFCGKVWIPEGEGDGVYPPCPTCDEIWATMS